MDIEDLLAQEKFKELDKFLNEEMINYAGKDLIEKMTKVWGNKEVARKWFYSNALALGNERPYDYCKKGKQKEVNDLLGRIEYGVCA
ncbi:DUF2384 domain-containing protein [Candidatus Woesearchaeota archaeon]|nr:DUF2384 domain-containing protein [Candidatus Woesearchaeota archaeon]